MFEEFAVSVFLWVIQIVLAVMFLAAGLMKATKPKAELREKLAFVDDFSASTVKFIGITQVLAAIGLILPAVTGIATFLTPLAATGLVITMLLAIGVHIKRGEYPNIVVNVVLLILAGLVAWGRFGAYAF